MRSFPSLCLAAILAMICTPIISGAAEYYVATTGADTNPGTLEQPFASVARGQQAAAPGDTVWIRGGEYNFSGTQIQVGVLFNKSGQEGKRINYFAYKDEVPVFDFFKLLTAVRIKGFSVTGNWLHFRGLELRGVQQILTNVNESWCIRVEGGSNNIFERLNLHHNEGPGFFISTGGNNLVLNCDSHHNYDPDRGGENGDGFGCHSPDSGNVLRGCRTWCNSDDGSDFINCRGMATIEYCWSWRNGFVPDTTRPAGNGAGIKAGGHLLNPANFPPNPAHHTIRFNLSFQNKAQGFYANYHPATLYFYNNTAFNNPRNFDMQTVVNPVIHILRNNIAFGTGQIMANINGSHPDDQFNSWNTGFNVSEADFESIVPEGMDAPRGPDGSLPKITFMHLKPGSKLIDAGKDVGLVYKGAAPDLGAFETGVGVPPPAMANAPAGYIVPGTAAVAMVGAPGPVDVGAAASPILTAVRSRIIATDVQWVIIQPKLQKVMNDLDVLGLAPPAGLLAGRGGLAAPAAPTTRPTDPAMVAYVDAQEALRLARADAGSTDDQLTARTKAVRDARAKAMEILKVDRAELRKVVNERQEATLVSLGYLD